VTDEASGRHERAAAITAHVERHIGSVSHVYPSAAPGGPDVLHVPPTEERRYHTLITRGMSDWPMAVPSDVEAPCHLELMSTLPKTWVLDPSAGEGHASTWPVRELQRLAQIPQRAGTWFAWGHTIAHGDPPKPFASDTQLCGVILVPSLMVPRAFYELATSDRTVTFYSIVPLYREELELKGQVGMERLLEKLIDSEVDDVVRLKRRNVARRRFLGLF
jgi:hypothetical protein